MTMYHELAWLLLGLVGGLGVGWGIYIRKTHIISTHNEEKWHIEPPTEEGEYLVVSSTISSRLHYEVLSYTKNLHKLDKYDFAGAEYKRPGWYDYSSEWGFYERGDIKAWSYINEFKEENDE